MNEDGYKEVYFDVYCETCKHKNVDETEEPCDTCLANPMNLYSHRPIKYEEKQKYSHNSRD